MIGTEEKKSDSELALRGQPRDRAEEDGPTYVNGMRGYFTDVDHTERARDMYRLE